MTRITVTATLREQLHHFTKPLELCDESGNVLATVTPLVDLSEYEPWEPPITEEDLKQWAKEDNKWYTTEEVLAHLKSLENQ